ncbi:MAG TPA: diguanylate cyclase [Chromatiales bacterium]|nr:diguanylate cyclase [Chromatiales bacterium]
MAGWLERADAVTDGSTQNLNSPFAEQLSRGFRWLRFGGFMEDEFCQSYVRESHARARLIIGMALITVVMRIGGRLTGDDVSWFMVGFLTLVIMPILVSTLYLSSHPERHQLYQFMLAVSALLIGLVINSIVTRAILAGMPYYFAGTVAWIFVTWVTIGLMFRHAAATALIISATYVWGLVNWQIQAPEAVFEMVIIGVVNIIGGYCCYQLEYVLRRSFLESRVLSQLAQRDGLTGLYNRRSFDEHMDRLWRQSRRERSQLTLLLVDIDHFKDFNDHYGHQAGDDALKKVAEVIGFGAQRPLDFAARYGGEEFALLLYGPGGEYARNLPEQIRQAVLDLKISHQKSGTGPYLTVSVGVAHLMPDMERSMAGAIQMADEALYQAKENGRNTVVVKESNSTIQTGRFRVTRKAASA